MFLPSPTRTLITALACAFCFQTASAEEPDRTQAVNGNLHTIIAPTYNGAGGNTSFIRFFNSSTGNSSTFSITVVGSPSSNTYGTGTLQVPANASFQRSLTEILTLTNSGPLTGGDTNYSVYVRNSDGGAAFQHVIYNNINGFFEDVTVCQFFSGAQHNRVVPLVANMHTSRLSGYPSEIAIHNYTNASRSYVASVFDSITGTFIGNVPVTVGANTTVRLTSTQIEQTLNFSPSPTQFHVNVKLGDAGSELNLTALISHLVLNTAFSAPPTLNMTQLCRLKT